MKIYVDGSYYEDLRIAGYAFAVIEDENLKHVVKGAKSIKKGNSIISELLGVINALEYCKSNKIKEIVIFHDYNEIPMFASAYRKTKNSYINVYINKLRKLCQEINVTFKKVKAHKNDKFNNLVDRLSRESIEEFMVDRLKSSKYFKKVR